MVQGRGKKARQKRNVLSNMEKHTMGPLAALLNYKEQRARVKVRMKDMSLLIKAK